jgi:hypothetical protein
VSGFCSEVLGQLVKLDVRKKSSMESGFVSRKEVEKILRGSLQSQIPGMGSKGTRPCDEDAETRTVL